ncbi:hypothetical protein HELRODRAFT_80560 [Helobdella robusta]|uniref:Dihydrolipoyllysine-residue succinyltransferase component of 2-oxoglutarate dehydrogenase complex, mitochondrial n=1 Tax=Helobdella robusta TaxID=6412 RepID=T1G421_HELRO|nr:hypothetical protein HELRODRAFT_80560 [Helobdella robusta]ESO03479.1 hypothetical protein HELRODRAFT_80560 [Helobdella robusta]
MLKFSVDEVKIVSTPPFADSVSEGDVKFQKAVGDAVSEDEIVCEIETDKTSIPVPSPANGVIEALLVEDGSKVLAGTQLFKLKITAPSPAASVPSPPPPPPKAASPPPTPAAAPKPPPPVPAPIPKAPAPSAPLPSKPISTTPAAAPARPKPSTDGSKPVPGLRTEERIKMNRMRLRIAQRLKDAQNTCAMLTTFNEIDMSNIMEMREKYKEQFVKKHGTKLGFMSPFLKASAYALKDQPVVNAVIDENEIVYRDYVDISVAVATPKGLVVPVLRNVEVMNCAEIEKALYELGEKAKKNEIAVEDMDGGTFTISNGGVFGSLMGTPIINPPQSAILGMHGIFERPVAIKGEVKVRPMMYVALTYDHRLIDGREAVTFLRKIKSAIEDPRVMLLDL